MNERIKYILYNTENDIYYNGILYNVYMLSHSDNDLCNIYYIKI